MEGLINDEMVAFDSSLTLLTQSSLFVSFGALSLALNKPNKLDIRAFDLSLRLDVIEAEEGEGLSQEG